MSLGNSSVISSSSTSLGKRLTVGLVDFGDPKGLARVRDVEAFCKVGASPLTSGSPKLEHFIHASSLDPSITILSGGPRIVEPQISQFNPTFTPTKAMVA
jgi:hypothetical protein